MDNYPLISVITPVYNSSNYIRRTLDSVLNQTYKNFELIIVDDCSTDNTLEVVESYNDKRIKIIKLNQNGGAANSRNVGIKEAKGNYIAFLDGDDYWDYTKLEEQLTFMINNNCHFSCTNYFLRNDNEDEPVYIYSSPKVITHSLFMRANWVGCLSIMVKSDYIKDIQTPNNILKRNDYAMWLKISEQCPCMLLNKILAVYVRRNKNSLSSVSKGSLTKHHYLMFRNLYHFGKFHCAILVLRNVFYHFWKNLLYRKKVKKTTI